MKWFIYSLLFSIKLSFAQKAILPDFHADPSIRYWDNKFWIYPSTDEKGSKNWSEMKRWHTYSSTDLVNWKFEGEIFNLEKISWASNSAFAPDAIKCNGMYYFFFPAEFQIGVAVSKTPKGPFVDVLGKPLIKKEQVKGVLSFDPHIFIDKDKIPYLFYGGGNGIAVAKLKSNLTEVEGEIKKLPLKNYHEGIWVHKRKNTYYFTYPIMIKRNGKVKQLLAYSTASSLLGPYTYKGSFFDNNSRNSHHSIIQIEDKWYLFYHIEGPSPYERKVCVDYLEYDENGNIMKVNMTKTGIKALK